MDLRNGKEVCSVQVVKPSGDNEADDSDENGPIDPDLQTNEKHELNETVENKVVEEPLIGGVNRNEFNRCVELVLKEIRQTREYPNYKVQKLEKSVSTVVFRSFYCIKKNKEHELIGFGYFNSYDFKEIIDSMFSLPAATYVRYEQLLESNILNDQEVQQYNKTNDDTPSLYKSLAPVLAVSDSERGACKIANFVSGWTIVSSQGLDRLSVSKFKSCRPPNQYSEQLAELMLVHKASRALMPTLIRSLNSHPDNTSKEYKYAGQNRILTAEQVNLFMGILSVGKYVRRSVAIREDAKKVVFTDDSIL